MSVEVSIATISVRSSSSFISLAPSVQDSIGDRLNWGQVQIEILGGFAGAHRIIDGSSQALCTRTMGLERNLTQGLIPIDARDDHAQILIGQLVLELLAPFEQTRALIPQHVENTRVLELKSPHSSKHAPSYPSTSKIPVSSSSKACSRRYRSK